VAWVSALQIGRSKMARSSSQEAGCLRLNLLLAPGGHRKHTSPTFP